MSRQSDVLLCLFTFSSNRIPSHPTPLDSTTNTTTTTTHSNSIYKSVHPCTRPVRIDPDRVSSLVCSGPQSRREEARLLRWWKG